MTEATELQPPMSCFHLTAVDDLATGELLVEMRQLPEVFDKNSPAHVVARFLRDNWSQICAVAAHEAVLAERLAAQVPEQERQLVLPAGLVTGGSSVLQVESNGNVSQGASHG